MNIDRLAHTAVFKGMTEAEMLEALSALNAHERAYKKGFVIMHAGYITKTMGLVLEGSVTVESNDMWGNRTILSYIGEGQFFAETYALLSDEPMLVDVTANDSCRILFLEVSNIRQLLNSDELWPAKLITNLLEISLRKNLTLSGRSFHTSPKSVRGRVMAYLNSVSLQEQSLEFDIPFDRQQLADYINLDRSALSKELGKMQRDGIIITRKNHFIILKTDA